MIEEESIENIDQSEQANQPEQIIRYWGFCLPESAVHRWRKQFRLDESQGCKEELADWNEAS